MFLSHRRGVRGYLAISRGLVAVGAGDARGGASAPPTKPSASRPASRWRCCSTRNARSSPATAPRPSTRSAPWRSATTPSCSACAASMSRRSAGRITPRRAPMPRRRRTPRRRSAGPGRRCWSSAAPPATGPAALAALDRNSRYGLIDKADYKRQRAVLLTARALAAEESERDRARSLALDALKLAPTLVPGGRAGRTAARRSRRAAPRQPHHREGLGGQSASRSRRHLCASASRRFRARAADARAGAGAESARAIVESALAVARAALDAQEFAVARERAPAAAEGADPARRRADGGDRAARERRRRPRPRMDGARAARAARSGLDRRRLRVGPLDAGVAGQRAARRVPMEGAAGRNSATRAT